MSSIDPKTVRFSMPTVASDDIQFVVPSRQSFEGAPQFHEDEWRQVEFYPPSHIDALQRRLIEYKAFEQQHRTEYGWTDIYARRIPGPGILRGPAVIADLTAMLRAIAQPSPILTTTSAPLGQVKDGYTLRLADTVFLYGVAGGSGIESLGAMVESGGDDMCLTTAFARLHQQHKLILIDWRAQMLLTSVEPNGQISIWRP